MLFAVEWDGGNVDVDWRFVERVLDAWELVDREASCGLAVQRTAGGGRSDQVDESVGCSVGRARRLPSTGS